jgi:hypothetical protein
MFFKGTLQNLIFSDEVLHKKKFFNPNPHCLGIQKASFVKMKISPGWLNQNISLKIKNASQKILTNFFVSEYFIQNVIFSMLLMIM